MEELQKQIDELRGLITALDGRVPADLKQSLDLMQRSLSEAAIAIAPPVSGTPTVNGSIATRINGQRVNLMTTA